MVTLASNVAPFPSRKSSDSSGPFLTTLGYRKHKQQAVESLWFMQHLLQQFPMLDSPVSRQLCPVWSPFLVGADGLLLLTALRCLRLSQTRSALQLLCLAGALLCLTQECECSESGA